MKHLILIFGILTIPLFTIAQYYSTQNHQYPHATGKNTIQGIEVENKDVTSSPVDTISKDNLNFFIKFIDPNKAYLPGVKELKEKIDRYMNTNQKDSTLIQKNLNKTSVLYNDNTRHKTTVNPIYKNRNFAGSNDINSFPNDNSIAISNSGYIVSVSNSLIDIFTESGNKIHSNTLNNFLNIPTSSGSLYDPKVIYDNVANEFFIVCLQGNKSNTSRFIVGHLNGSNPTQGYSYIFSTNSIINNQWFDFPNIGINADYVFIGLNGFDDNNQFTGSYIIRFAKSAILSNMLNLNYTYWNTIKDIDGDPGFSPFPISYGLAGTYGPGMNFISSIPSQGNYYQFWDLDNNNNKLTGYKVAANSYMIGGKVDQFLAPNKLDAGDCRISGAFAIYDASQQIWTYYFTHTSTYNGSGTRNGMIKGKIVWKGSNLTYSGIAYGGTNVDITHSNISLLSNNPLDENVLLSGNVSSSQFYPRYTSVASDINNSFSNPIDITIGAGSINDFDSHKQISRYGDYSGNCKKFNAQNPTIWLAGSYGDIGNNSPGTWLAEISTNKSNVSVEVLPTVAGNIYPNPTNNKFYYDFSVKESREYSITLLTVDGRYSKKLFDNYLPTGKVSLGFETTNLPDGTYMIVVSDNNTTIATTKLTIIH